MNRMKDFSPTNPTGTSPGVEPLRLDLLKAAVANEAPRISAPAPAAPVPLVHKNIRLPADLVEFIDFVYTKDNRLKKQDAYTQAVEAFFRPLMGNK